MKRPLSNRLLDSAGKPFKRVVYGDLRIKNLLVVIETTGRIYWRWQGQVDGKVTQVRLGQYPAMDVAQARRAAAALTDARDAAKMQGIAFEVPRFRKSEAATPTDPEDTGRDSSSVQRNDCNWLWDLYMRHEGSKRKSAKEKQRCWQKDISPFIGHKLYDEVTYDDLADIIAAKAANRSHANHLVSYIKRLFRWAVTRGRPFTRLSVDPAAHLVGLGNTAPVERFLSDREIRWFFMAAAAHNSTFSQALQLLLYTGARRSEVFDMPWSEYDAQTGHWTIPGSRTKNGDPHLLPLPAPCQTLLRDRMKESGEGIYVFPAQRADQPMTGYSKAMGRFRAKMAELASEACGGEIQIPNWTIHDLRRTLHTGMNGLTDKDGASLIPAEIVERVVNHRIGGVAAKYNWHNYRSEKLRALRLWAEHLDRLRPAWQRSTQTHVELQPLLRDRVVVEMRDWQPLRLSG
jgi:integrase